MCVCVHVCELNHAHLLISINWIYLDKKCHYLNQPDKLGYAKQNYRFDQVFPMWS